MGSIASAFFESSAGRGFEILTVIMVKALTVLCLGHIPFCPIRNEDASNLTYGSMALLMKQPYEASDIKVI